MSKTACQRCGGGLYNDLDGDVRCLACGRAAKLGDIRLMMTGSLPASICAEKTGRHTAPYARITYTSLPEYEEVELALSEGPSS